MFLFFRSGRGQVVFIYDGHIYTLFDINGTRKLWVCAKARSMMCSGHLVTSTGPAVTSYGLHNHLPLFDIIAKLKINTDNLVDPKLI